MSRPDRRFWRGRGDIVLASYDDFVRKALDISEAQLACSFFEDPELEYLKRVFNEYTAVGEAEDISPWLHRRLSLAFASVAERPKWLGFPAWPFVNGEPMVFINQYELPSNAITEEMLSPGTNVYVFAKRIENEDGWEIFYQVVEQDPDSADLAIMTDDPAALDSLTKDKSWLRLIHKKK